MLNLAAGQVFFDICYLLTRVPVGKTLIRKDRQPVGTGSLKIGEMLLKIIIHRLLSTEG